MEKLNLILRIFQDLNLIGSNNKVMNKGKMTIKLYKEEKEKYFKMKNLLEKKLSETRFQK
ncbi:MAG: hypothetical protein ACTSVE_15240 [Candidatus Helarchaeota archaeon]